MAWLETEKLTWELASTLPDTLIKEYETERHPSEIILTETKQLGVLNHTLVIADSDCMSEHPAKKMKMEEYESLMERGYVLIN